MTCRRPGSIWISCIDPHFSERVASRSHKRWKKNLRIVIILSVFCLFTILMFPMLAESYSRPWMTCRSRPHYFCYIGWFSLSAARTTSPISPTGTSRPSAHTPCWCNRVTTPAIPSGWATPRRPRCGMMTRYAPTGGAPRRPWRGRRRRPTCCRAPTGTNFSAPQQWAERDEPWERSQASPVRTGLGSVAEQVVCENNPDFNSLYEDAFKFTQKCLKKMLIAVCF